MNSVKKVSYILISLLITWFLYILLHELGHLIVLLYAGAKITDFSIFTAHVSAEGGDFSNLCALWLHANGALFPIIVSLVYMLFYKKGNSSSLYHIFSFVALLPPFYSLLAWVVIPFIYTQGNAPSNDDATMFLQNFTQKYPPLLVSAAAILIIAAIAVIMVKKGIIKNFIGEIRKQ